MQENPNRNTNQSHSEMSSHTCHHQKEHILARMWRKGNPRTLLVEMHIGATTVEYSMEVSQTTKNIATVWPGVPLPGINLKKQRH